MYILIFKVQREQTVDILFSLLFVIFPRMFSVFVMCAYILFSHSSSFIIRMRVEVILWYSITLSCWVVLVSVDVVCGIVYEVFCELLCSVEFEKDVPVKLRNCCLNII